jgi:hypothetical protein
MATLRRFADAAGRRVRLEGVRSATGAAPAGSSIHAVLPTPRLLRMPRLPPIASVRPLARPSPRPVPSIPRLAASRRSNGVNRPSMSCWLMPIPVSVTSMRISPDAVSLGAQGHVATGPVVLDRVGDQVQQHLHEPLTVGRDPQLFGDGLLAQSHGVGAPPAARRGTVPPASPRRAGPGRSIAAAPRSRRVRCRARHRRSPADAGRRRGSVRASRADRARADRISSSCPKPRIAFNGVLSSWLTRERNPVFSSLRCSASSCARPATRRSRSVAA